MLKDNIVAIRKSKGLSQEELAIKLNVVRQTVSKWETGASIPDCEMLIRIAEALDTSVGVLLGEAVEEPKEESDLSAIAARLELLNTQLAKLNEGRRKLWHCIFTVICVTGAVALLISLTELIRCGLMMSNVDENIAVIGGYDGPTNIYVADVKLDVVALLLCVAVIIISVVGLYKTRKQ